MAMPPSKFSNYPHRRYTGNPISDDPEDFSDVFGGPPLTILSHHYATKFPRSPSSTGFFYEDIFRLPENVIGRTGRNLPLFRIPTSEQPRSAHQCSGSCCDNERVGRSRSRSKASSSSAFSSEERSPSRPAVSDNGYDDVYLFGSKLRSNVRSFWNSIRFRHENHQRSKQQKSPLSADRQVKSEVEDFHGNFSNYENIINLVPKENNNFKRSADDSHFNSSPSSVSSVCHSDRETNTREKIEDDDLWRDNRVYMEQEEKEDDVSMFSYAIKNNCSEYREQCSAHDGSNGVDEAIAWAKEKFQAHCLREKQAELGNDHHLSKRHADSFLLVDEQQHESTTEKETSKIQVEMQLLDQKIRLWSIGKEDDIRLLLSSLHHILWANSGWITMNIIDNSQVKKAYQKAQLCLHPDKLQQRGATAEQKYIAYKVFSTLQDAWIAFVSQSKL